MGSKLYYTDCMTGEQLYEIRLRLGWTQATLAERVGVHGNTIARWERDEVGVSEPESRLIRLIYVQACRDGARNRVVEKELRGRTAGSTDRDRMMRAAERAERRAVRELKELLGEEEP